MQIAAWSSCTCRNWTEKRCRCGGRHRMGRGQLTRSIPIRVSFDERSSLIRRLSRAFLVRLRSKSARSKKRKRKTRMRGKRLRRKRRKMLKPDQRQNLDYRPIEGVGGHRLYPSNASLSYSNGVCVCVCATVCPTVCRSQKDELPLQSSSRSF